MMDEYCGEPQYAYIQYSADPQEGLQLIKVGKQPWQEKRLGNPPLIHQDDLPTSDTVAK